MLVADTSVLLRHPVLPIYSSYPLHTPLFVSKWKAKKMQPDFLPTLLWQPTTQQLFTMTETSRPHVSIVLSAQRGPPMGVHFCFRHSRPPKYHLKFLHTFALKIPIRNMRNFAPYENFPLYDISQYRAIPNECFSARYDYRTSELSR